MELEGFGSDSTPLGPSKCVEDQVNLVFELIRVKKNNDDGFVAKLLVVEVQSFGVNEVRPTRSVQDIESS